MSAGGKSGKSGNKKSKSDDEEIVYSGQALQIAAGWLGISDVEAALAAEGNTPGGPGNIARPFKKHMGVGAAGPSKHQAGVAGLEHRLGRKVMMSSKARIGDRGGGQGSHGKGKSSEKNQPEEHSSDESEGRGAAIGKGNKRSAVTNLRAELLASGGSKRRKKKNGGGGG